MNAGGFKPKPRQGHISILLSDQLFVFGGTDGKTYYNELNVYDLTKKIWRVENPTGDKPSPRAFQAAAIDDRRRIFIFGGFSTEGYFSDIYVLDPRYNKWDKPVISGDKISARSSATITKVFSHTFRHFCVGWRQFLHFWWKR